MAGLPVGPGILDRGPGPVLLRRKDRRAGLPGGGNHVTVPIAFGSADPAGAVALRAVIVLWGAYALNREG
jgi:hypothetical protein